MQLTREYSQKIAAFQALSPKEKLGRCIAVTALFFPLLTFGLLECIQSITGIDSPSFYKSIMLACVSINCLLGLAGLGGIYWWGERGVWVPSVLGILLSVSWYLLAWYS